MAAGTSSSATPAPASATPAASTPTCVHRSSCHPRSPAGWNSHPAAPATRPPALGHGTRSSASPWKNGTHVNAGASCSWSEPASTSRARSLTAFSVRSASSSTSSGQNRGTPLRPSFSGEYARAAGMRAIACGCAVVVTVPPPSRFLVLGEHVPGHPDPVRHRREVRRHRRLPGHRHLPQRDVLRPSAQQREPVRGVQELHPQLAARDRLCHHPRRGFVVPADRVRLRESAFRAREPEPELPGPLGEGWCGSPRPRCGPSSPSTAGSRAPPTRSCPAARRSPRRRCGRSWTAAPRSTTGSTRSPLGRTRVCRTRTRRSAHSERGDQPEASEKSRAPSGSEMDSDAVRRIVASACRLTCPSRKAAVPWGFSFRSRTSTRTAKSCEPKIRSR